MEDVRERIRKHAEDIKRFKAAKKWLADAMREVPPRSDIAWIIVKLMNVIDGWIFSKELTISILRSQEEVRKEWSKEIKVVGAGEAGSSEQ